MYGTVDNLYTTTAEVLNHDQSNVQQNVGSYDQCQYVSQEMMPDPNALQSDVS